MPIYEYECRSCGNRIELVQKIGDGPPEKCVCGKSGTLKRLVSAPAIQFKGTGWYVTDYSDKGKSRRKEEGDSSKEKSKATESTKNTESTQKAESKTDTDA